MNKVDNKIFIDKPRLQFDTKNIVKFVSKANLFIKKLYNF